MTDTISDKLVRINEVKQQIKQSIIDKGVAVADTDPFSAYAGKIGQISGGGSTPTDEWQPNPNWWDIRKILDEDIRDYAGKVGVILYNFNDVSDFRLSSSGMTAVATSDGAFYSYANNGGSVSHNWDTTQDKDDGRGFKTRWVIYYYTTDTTSDSFKYYDNKYGWADNLIAYLVLRINLANGSSFCQNQQLLEAIDNVGHNINGTNFNGFCGSCYSLVKLPDVLDTSNGTNFSSFCSGCYSLVKLPDGLDTSNGTNFNGFCRECYSLRELPDSLDTSSGTNFNYFCADCRSLRKLPDVLDTSNGTSFDYFFWNCYSLVKLPDGLDTSKGTGFYYFCASVIPLLCYQKSRWQQTRQRYQNILSRFMTQLGLPNCH